MKVPEHDILMALSELEGWSLNKEFISKKFFFNDFKECISKMIQISFEAEKMNHHPNWSNVYNKLEINLSTHDKGGITQLDIDLAKKIENLV